MVMRWKFVDLTDNTTIVLEVNPNANGLPQLQKTITTQNTLAPGGQTLIFEGADVAPQITFTGTILTQSLYNTFVTLYNKRHQLQLTDDLGNISVVYMTQFQPQRVYQASNFWYQTYTCVLQIVDWPT